MLAPNSKVMPYKPRSGTFRKVRYPMAIYKEGEIPGNDLEEMLEMAKRIKTEDPYQAKSSDAGDEAERKLNIAMKKTMKSEPVDVDSSVDVKSQNTCLQNSRVLPQPEFSLVEVDLYSRAYPDDNSLPPFPVTWTDFNYSSDSEESQRDSDYDMDSEDEEWLKKNEELNITPSRLEYLFSKLNKRNTHVPEKAIGALPVTVHSDFYHLFPYWKEKRLQNKNSSSFKQNCKQQADAKLALGYVSTDPYVIFAQKVRKPLVQQSPPPSKPLQKLERQEEAKLRFKRMVDKKKILEFYRSFALKHEQKGLNARDMIQSKLRNFTKMVSDNENLEQKCKMLPMPIASPGTRITRRSSTENTSQMFWNLRKSTETSMQKLVVKPMVFRSPKKNVKFTHTQQKIPTFELIFSGKRKGLEKTFDNVQRNITGAARVRRQSSSNVKREP